MPNDNLYTDVASLKAEYDRLQLELEQKKSEVDLINQVVKEISALLDLDKILPIVAEKARTLISAESLIVPIIDKSREHYTYLAASGKNAEAIIGQTFSVNIGMCGWVLSHEQALLFGENSTMIMGQ
ncbi:MAG TPA: hypothetical protein VIQ03_14980, partial [Gammaproteobacteria bacterium]